MIELQTGSISFPDLAVTMEPFAPVDSVVSALSPERCHQIRDPKTGCTWYGAREKIYREDSVIPIWLHFNRENRLESVELYPQFGEEENLEGFPMDAEDSERKYCAAWLQKYCGLTWESSGFSWGTIRSDYDERSDSCGIVIRYTKGTDRREEN